MYGARMRLTRNPGALFTGNGSLSICRTNAAAALATRRSVARPCTTSTSIMRATGLKKWMPTSRVGSRSADAIVLERNARRVRREDRVGLRLLLDGREQRALRVGVLEDRLDDHVGSRDAVTRDIRDQPVGRVAHLARVAQALGEQLAGARRSRATAPSRSGPAA